MKKKPNLKLEIPSFHDEKNNNDLPNGNKDVNFYLQSPVEITSFKVIFKKEDLIIDNHCIKKISTGELLSEVIEPKELEVISKNIFNIFIFK